VRATEVGDVRQRTRGALRRANLSDVLALIAKPALGHVVTDRPSDRLKVLRRGHLPAHVVLDVDRALLHHRTHPPRQPRIHLPHIRSKRPQLRRVKLKGSHQGTSTGGTAAPTLLSTNTRYAVACVFTGYSCTMRNDSPTSSGSRASVIVTTSPGRVLYAPTGRCTDERCTTCEPVATSTVVSWPSNVCILQRPVYTVS